MTKRARLLGIAAILSATGLTACGNERVRLASVPVELTFCAKEPAAPDLPARDGTEAVQVERDRLTLDYVLALRSWAGDCAAKVAGVAAWNAKLGAQPER